MNKFSIFKIFQLFFRLILIFFLVFIWVRYYNSNLKFSVWVSLFITACIELILKLIKEKRKIKNQVNKQEQQIAENAINTFILNTKTQNLNFFLKTFTPHFENVTKHKTCVLVKQKNKQENETLAFVPYFTYSHFSVDNLIEILQKLKTLNATKIVICTNQSSPSAKTLAKSHKTPI